MRGQPRDELEKIAKIRKIKTYEEMTKEELIISLLKSKQSIVELFNNNNNDNNNNNNNNLYDNKISDIRRILNKLRDILPRKDRKEIKDKLYKIEHQRNLSDTEKEENDEYFRKLVTILNNKEEHGPHDRDDFDCYGIRKIENLFNGVIEEEYYKPIFVKSSFKGNYKYESRGDKKKRIMSKAIS